MATVTRPGPERPARAEKREVELSADVAAVRAPVRTAVTVVLALAAVGLAVAGLDGPGRSLRVASLVALAAWAIASGFVAFRRPAESTGLWMVFVPLVGAFALFADSRWRADGADWARVARGFGLALVPYAVLALVTALPDGTIRGRGRRILLVGGGVVAVAFGAIFAGERDIVSRATVVSEWVVLGLLAVGAFVARCRKASAVERARLQWAGWGAVVAAALALADVFLNALLEWPEKVAVVAIIASVFVPLSLALAAVERLVLFVDRLLVRTIEAGGIVLMVGGRVPRRRPRFRRRARRTRPPGARLVDGRRRDRRTAVRARPQPTRRVREPPRVRRAPGAGRAAPDVRRAHVACDPARRAPAAARGVAEEEHAASPRPRCGPAPTACSSAPRPCRSASRPLLRLTDDEQQVVARAHVSGNAWVQVWLPSLLANHPNRMLRVVAAGALGRAARPARDRPRERRHSRSPTRRSACSRSSPARSRSRCTTPRSTPRCRRRSTTCASRTKSCARRGRASSRPPTSRAARSSATCTTARSSTSSRSR